MRPFVIKETNLYTSFWYKFTDKKGFHGKFIIIYIWHLVLSNSGMSSLLHSSYRWWIVSINTDGWFPNLTRAYDNNGRCPRQKFVFGILQLYVYKHRLLLHQSLTSSYDIKGRWRHYIIVLQLTELIACKTK